MTGAKNGIQEKFQEQETREKELTYAESHAEKILSNGTAWRMLEDLAEYMVQAILSGQKGAEKYILPEKYDLPKEYWFKREDIYKNFEISLIGEDS